VPKRLPIIWLIFGEVVRLPVLAQAFVFRGRNISPKQVCEIRLHIPLPRTQPIRSVFGETRSLFSGDRYQRSEIRGQKERRTSQPRTTSDRKSGQKKDETGGTSGSEAAAA